MVSPQAPGIPDDAFSRGSAPMSKMEIRAVTTAKARIAYDSRVLDVGAGTGALTVDAALACPSGSVVAVEHDAEALELLRHNVARLAPGNVTVVAGEAPDVFEQVEGGFDAVLIGGSGGRLTDIVASLPSMLAPGARVVVNTIGLASTAATLEVLGSAPWADLDCVQLNVSRAERIGLDLRFVPLNPVWVTSATLGEEAAR
jgi:precorrin-6Y C5,15-methyltransferase (decarboxylating) CbiT subunit